MAFLKETYQDSVTAIVHTRPITSSGKPPFIIKKVFIADVSQHYSKVSMANICLDNNWILPTKGRNTWGIYTVTLTETGHRLIEGTK